MTDEAKERTSRSGATPAVPDALSTPGREASGRTVGEAIEQGLAALGLDRSRVEVEVLDEGSRGLLGLGGREARIRLTVRSSRAGTADAVARKMLSLMGISADVRAEEGPESILVNLEGADIGPLIGKHGQTLGALETLLALMVGRKTGAPVRVELDAEGYRERRQASLEDLARRTAERAARQGREIALTPMGPRDRRIVHVVLQDHPLVSTVSRGERDMRRVVIVPKDAEGRQGHREDGGQPGTFSTPAPGGDTSYESQPEGPQELETGRFGPSSPPGGQRSPRRRRPGPPGSRRPRPGSSGAFGRRPPLPHPQAPKGARPDGLPSDEELEAEIEAYLARTRSENPKESDSAPGAQSDPQTSASDDRAEEEVE